MHAIDGMGVSSCGTICGSLLRRDAAYVSPLRSAAGVCGWNVIGIGGCKSAPDRVWKRLTGVEEVG